MQLPQRQSGNRVCKLCAASQPDTVSAETDTDEMKTLTQDLISKLRFRELQTELEHRRLETTGTTGQLRTRLKKAEGILTDDECAVENTNDDDYNSCVDYKVRNHIRKINGAQRWLGLRLS